MNEARVMNQTQHSDTIQWLNFTAPKLEGISVLIHTVMQGTRLTEDLSSWNCAT